MSIPPPDPAFVLRGTGAAVNSLNFNCGIPEQQPLLFSGSENGLIHVWNLKTHRAGTKLDGHNGKSVLWVEALQRGNTILSQGRDQQVCLWNIDEGREQVTDSIFTESVGFCRCSLLSLEPGQWMLAVPSGNMSEVQILNLPSKTRVCTLEPDADAKLGMPMCMKLWQPLTSSAPLLLVGYEDGSVTLWNTAERKVLSRLKCHVEPVMSLDFDPQKARGISGSSDRFLHSWKLDEQQNLKLHEQLELTNAGIADIQIRQDCRILATAGWDHRIRIFGWKKIRPLAVLQYHSDSVHCVAFSDHSKPAERQLAAGSKDQRISIWSIYNET
ncbi:guanine nucleotide-binding protein subunit beta-like protein 1 [Protopterus annectens]|uniref:guanine nucleotide-binding protein subunit beta-like protein 1 n=1 Tax=Protopterus annectens TaxID=7888 RepID=UPI001CFB1D19|nr:guanine nucleotide-binding protein subunit beta-like protein 1 [Protopterus annectens]XP_043924632.1 guanine nucleotide-binding protein subunit beta-like protein 1 [Protopterus annectens]